MVGVLADDVKEGIWGCSFSGSVVPFSFEVLRQVKGPNIESSEGLVREGVIIIDMGIRDRKVFIRGNMV